MVMIRHNTGISHTTLAYGGEERGDERGICHYTSLLCLPAMGVIAEDISLATA